MSRPKKVFRLNYHLPDPQLGAHITILGNPAEVRIGSNEKAFVSVTQKYLTLSGGFPSTINIQGMSSSFKYAAMLQDLPFPMSLIPSTLATPFPKQIMTPPLLEELPTIQQLASLAGAMVPNPVV